MIRPGIWRAKDDHDVLVAVLGEAAFDGDDDHETIVMWINLETKRASYLGAETFQLAFEPLRGE